MKFNKDEYFAALFFSENIFFFFSKKNDSSSSRRVFNNVTEPEMFDSYCVDESQENVIKLFNSGDLFLMIRIQA